MRGIKILAFGLFMLIGCGLARAGGVWKLHSVSAPGNMGTITGIQYVSDADGDRFWVQFSGSTTPYYTRLQDFGGDNSKFNRMYSGLLTIQTTGQVVTDVFISGQGSNVMLGYNIGNYF